MPATYKNYLFNLQITIRFETKLYHKYRTFALSKIKLKNKKYHGKRIL